MNGPMRARVYLRARVFDENTGVGVEPGVWECHFCIEN